MTPHANIFRARPLHSDTAAISAIPREDATWTRPIFRPPPLDVQPFRPVFGYSGTTHRTEPWATWSRQSAVAR
jgi:hypothetical protein